MSNTFVSLPLPVGIGPAAAASVSGLATDKTLIVGGAPGALNQLLLEGSVDGSNFAPILVVTEYRDGDALEFRGAYSHVRLNLRAGVPPTNAGVGGEDTTASLFSALPIPNTGTGAAVDSSTFGGDQTYVVSGTYSGILVVEGSNDGGTNYDPIVSFNTGASEVKSAKGVYQRLRARHVSGSGTPSVGVGAQPLGGGSSGASPFGPAGTDSVAVPSTASATGTESAAFGVNAQANTSNSVAVGYNAQAPGGTATAVGFASSAAQDAAAVGGNAFAGLRAVAMGRLSTAGTDSVVIGQGANATSLQNVVVGRGASINNQNGVAIGYNAVVGNVPSGVAVGVNSNVQGQGGVAVGDGAAIQSGTQFSVAIGSTPNVTGSNSVAIGTNAAAESQGVVIGGFTVGTSPGSIIIGHQAHTTNGLTNPTAIGHNAEAQADYAIAIGTNSVADGQEGIAIGRSAITDMQGVAIGPNAVTNQPNCVAIGNGATIDGLLSVAVGQGAVIGVNADFSIAIGRQSQVAAAAANGVALGQNTSVTGTGGIAIGAGASAAANQCIIGSPGASSQVTEFRVVADGIVDPLRAITNPTASNAGFFLVANDGTNTVVAQVRLGAAGTGPGGGTERALYIDTGA